MGGAFIICFSGCFALIYKYAMSLNYYSLLCTWEEEERQKEEGKTRGSLGVKNIWSRWVGNFRK